jgi:hypothetical protein
MGTQGRSSALPDLDRLTPSEERARIYIGKGFRWIRNGRLDGAMDQFVAGLTIEPALQFDRIPGFWDLPRDGHGLAVRALEHLGQPREAARLQAIIDRRYRPKLVTTRSRTSP